MFSGWWLPTNHSGARLLSTHKSVCLACIQVRLLGMHGASDAARTGAMHIWRSMAESATLLNKRPPGLNKKYATAILFFSSPPCYDPVLLMSCMLSTTLVVCFGCGGGPALLFNSWMLFSVLDSRGFDGGGGVLFNSWMLFNVLDSRGLGGGGFSTFNSWMLFNVFDGLGGGGGGAVLFNSWMVFGGPFFESVFGGAFENFCAHSMPGVCVRGRGVSEQP